MRNLRRFLFLSSMAALLCMGAFVASASPQRYGGNRFTINFSVGSGGRSYYPRYRRYPRRVYGTYYAPPPVYYSPGYYNSGYYNPGYYAPAYNTGYYAPAYNTGYYVRQRRHRHLRSCDHYTRY